MLEEKYAQFAEEEIESFKAYCANKISGVEECKKEDDDTEDVSDDARILYKAAIGTLGYDYSSDSKIDEINRGKRKYTNYSSLVRDDIDDEEFVEEVNPVKDPDEPFVISEEEFSETSLNHEKVSITYYAGDDVLADEGDSIMEDIDKVVGYKNLDMKNTTVQQPHTIFVRNNALSIDYEISIDLGAYQQAVLGIPTKDNSDYGLSPREIQAKRMKAKEEAKEDE